MPKMERYQPEKDDPSTISVEDISFMIKELFKSLESGHVYDNWEKGFINGMNKKLVEGSGFTEGQITYIKKTYDRHLSTGDINDT